MASSSRPSPCSPGPPQPALTADDVPRLYSVLQEAQSKDRRVREPADKFLRSCEPRAGFCSALLAVLSERGAEATTRVLAIICLKNVVRRHWSPRQHVKALGTAV